MIISPRTYEAYSLLHDGTLALARAEQQGLRVDLVYIAKQKKLLSKRIVKIEEEFKQTTLFRHWQHTVKGTVNIHSGPQLGAFLYGVKKLTPPGTTKTGKGSTDDKALIQLNIPEINTLLEAKKLKKLIDYLDLLEREQVAGYIHPFFNLNMAVTFRSSSSDPNFQNLPNRDEEAMKIVRGAIYPRPGHKLIEADFSGIEVRVNACINHDQTLIKYIKDPTSDMHRDIAKQIFLIDEFDKPTHGVLRQAAKNAFVFPEFYGSWYKNCADGLACNWGKLSKDKWKRGQGIEIGSFEPVFLSDHLIKQKLGSYDKFTEHVRIIEKDFWENRFKEYAQWKKDWWYDYKKNGYFDLPTGFRCQGPMDEKQACNYPGQGSAFHCLLWSFINVDKRIRKEKWDTRIVGQIHDSIVLDVNVDEEDHVKEVINQILTKDLPKAFPWICVPMEIEINDYPIDGSWAEKIK